MRFTYLLLLSVAACLPHNVLSPRHGDDEDMEESHAGHSMAMDMSHPVNASELVPVPHRSAHHHGMPILKTKLHPEERLFWEAYNTTTYFTVEDSNKSALIAHVLLILLASVILYPITLVLHNVQSKWYLPLLFVHYGTLFGSMFSLSIFSSSLKASLYPNNAYGKMSVVLLFLGAAQLVFAILSFGLNWLNGDEDAEFAQEKASFVPLRKYLHQRGTSSLSPSSTLYDSNEHERDYSIDQQDNQEMGNSDSAEFRYSDDSLDLESNLVNENFTMGTKPKSKLQSKRDALFNKFFQNEFFQKFANANTIVVNFFFKALTYSVFIYYFIYLPVGVAVGNLMGQGSKVFNLLAHFIKGGVFATLGVVSLARYCGCWKEQGLAWNTVKFDSKQEKNSANHVLTRYSPFKGLFTMEFIESFLIFFYGSTNIFMEHLANPGGEWAAKDLQHVSIAFMFIGGGLCGLLTEYGLSSWRLKKARSEHGNKNAAFGTPGYSPNPFPAFTIFWTGILMSQHAQASETSTKIHIQWGYMLAYGAIVRVLTYIILILTPNPSKSKKPITELIVSFALLAGGLIFMESTDQVVLALEYRGLTPMFTLNVSVGCVALFMSWEMVLLFWKNWLKNEDLD